MKTHILQLMLDLRTIKWPILTAALSWLLALALGGYVLWEQQAGSEQAGRIAALRNQLASQSDPGLPPSIALSPEQAFESVLGDPAQLEQHLRIMFQIAGKQNISLKQGSYKKRQSNTGNHDVYTIDLPISGSYAKVKTISEQMLLALPFSALEEIKFKRENVGTDALETQLKFALFLKPAELTLDAIGSSTFRDEKKPIQKPGDQL